MYDAMTSSPLDVGSGSLTTYHDAATEQRHYSQEHIASAVIGVFLLVFGTYMVGTLSLHQYKEKRKIKQRKTGPQKDPVLKLNNWSNWLCIAGAVFALARFVLDMVDIFQKEIPGDPCRWVRNVKGVFQCGALTCLYFVLWLRQRHFYSIHIIACQMTPIVKFFSYAVIFFMVAANLVTITLYVAMRTYKTSSRGCRLDWSIGWNKLPGLLFFIFTTSFQVILLGLFINLFYPCISGPDNKTKNGQKTENGPKIEKRNNGENDQKIENKQKTKCVAENEQKTINITENKKNDGNETVSRQQEIKSRQSEYYKPLIKRLVIAMSLTVGSSSFVSLLAITVLDGNYGALRQVVYGLDMSVTLLSVICSFKDWRSRLCSYLAETKAETGNCHTEKNEQSAIKCVKRNLRQFRNCAFFAALP